MQDINVIIDAFIFGSIFEQKQEIHSKQFEALILGVIQICQLPYKYFYDTLSIHLAFQ